MQFMAIIYSDPEWYANASEADIAAELAAYYDYDDATLEAGIREHWQGAALHPAETAKTIRIRDGKRIVTDGPFAETKEQLGGFYMLECKDLDEAIEWASKIPGALNGSVEVRQVMEFPSADEFRAQQAQAAPR
jgi:hypothetical protein